MSGGTASFMVAAWAAAMQPAASTGGGKPASSTTTATASNTDHSETVPLPDASTPAASDQSQVSKGATPASPKPASGSSELLLFEDIPMVVTAGRSAQAMNMSAAPVVVLTADDLHYGGLTNIAEALRFVPGVDVTRVDRNRYGVGIHGFDHWISARNVTLLDGRESEMPMRGTTDFVSLPVFMEDIERIEVVRGPSGAAWGANAPNGVINIITKDPEDTKGLLFSSRVDEFGDTSSEFRWGAGVDNWTWRISAGWLGNKSSEDAISNDDFISEDFNRELIVDGVAVYKPSDLDKLTFGLSNSTSARRGTYDANPFYQDTEHIIETRAFARWDSKFADGGSFSLQWAGLLDDRDVPSLSRPMSTSNQFDAQLNLAKIGAHTLSFGAKLWYLQIDLVKSNPLQHFFADGQDLKEYRSSIFGDDRIDLADNWWMEGQLRVDYSTRTKQDWSGRLAILHALDRRQAHMLRFAVARSYRTLNPEFRDVTLDAPIAIVPPYDNAKNEGSWSLEAGYTGRLNDHLTLRADGFYQRYDDVLDFWIPSPSAVQITTRNQTGAVSTGVDLQLTYKHDRADLSLWYSFDGFSVSGDDVGIRAYAPPKHSAGVTARYKLTDNLTFNSNYRFTDSQEFPNNIGGSPSLRASHRLDFTLTQKVAMGNAAGEIQVGVENVLNRFEEAGFEFQTGAPVTPGRTFFARFQMKF